MISAFMCGCGLSIGQKEVGEKTNEIPEIPKLLNLIDITECFVTIDAIGTQKDIMDKIKEKGGHFCLQLKRNQKNAFEDVQLFLRRYRLLYSTFFALGMTGVVNAVYNDADMILCVLDNSTTAMKGHQPHPGTGRNMMGQIVGKVSIPKVLEGCEF